MRVFLLLLLLLNVGFYAWSQHWARPASGDSHLVEQQLNREAIRILTPEQVAAGRREPTKLVACMEFGGFSSADAPRVEGQLATLALGTRLSQHRIDETAGWWVFMPPQGAREGAQKKVAELKRLGVEEFFILQDDPKFQFAISLGVFRTEEAARARLEALRARGVRTAQVGPRAMAVQRVVYEIRAVDESTLARLAGLKAEFAGADLKECARPAAAVPVAPTNANGNGKGKG